MNLFERCEVKIANNKRIVDMTTYFYIVLMPYREDEKLLTINRQIKAECETDLEKELMVAREKDAGGVG